MPRQMPEHPDGNEGAMTIPAEAGNPAGLRTLTAAVDRSRNSPCPMLAGPAGRLSGHLSPEPDPTIVNAP